MKIGLVFYSRTGHTKKVAEIIKDKLEKESEVDLIEIIHEKKPGFFGAGKSSAKQLDVPIKNTDFDLKKYDLIVAGTPIWAGNPSPYLKTFMNKAENINGKKAAIFMIGISPIDKRDNAKEKIKNDLEKVGLKPLKSTLLIRTKKDNIVEGEENIDSFVKNVLKS